LCASLASKFTTHGRLSTQLVVHHHDIGATTFAFEKKSVPMAATTEGRSRGEPQTPSPTEIHTPDAPRFGAFHDKGGPLSPRRSSRISGRTRDRTPSPTRSTATSSPKKRAGQPLAPALASPRKRPAPDMVRRASGVVTSESKPMAASVLDGQDAPSKLRPDLLKVPRGGMLLTPVKTPQQTEEKPAVNVESIARTLFNDDSVSSPRRQAKTKTTVETSFEASEEITVKIDIFTDSKERVPEKDESNSNPFWQPSGKAFAKTEKVSRAKVWIPAEQRAISVDEASKRNDGQVRVFRGRKIWVEKVQHEEVDEEEDDEEETLPAFKPKRLFVSKQQEKKVVVVEEKTEAALEAEEAPTDIEDETDEPEETAKSAVVESLSVPVPATPQAHKKSKLSATPDVPHMGPLSPPETRRVTRSMDKFRDATPGASPTRTPTGGRSPAFAGFKISKPALSSASKAAKSSRKRPGDHLAPTEAKRTKV
jgi:hypothetical protein